MTYNADRSLPLVGLPEPPGTLNEALTALQSYKKRDGGKVVIIFKAVGNTPVMKENQFQISSSNSFQSVILFLRKKLGYTKSSEPLHTYINQTFCPAPDDMIANLFNSFKTDNRLIVNYSTTVAWG